MYILLGGLLAERVDVVLINVHLIEQVALEPNERTLLVTGDNAQAKFADVERDDIGKAHFVGKVEFHQFVIDLQRALAGTEANHALTLGLDTGCEVLGDALGGFGRTHLAVLGNMCRDFLKARQRSKLQLALWAVIALRHLVEADV